MTRDLSAAQRAITASGYKRFREVQDAMRRSCATSLAFLLLVQGRYDDFEYRGQVSTSSYSSSKAL